MNRIILIGNGFDLAHGLKTSYFDFVEHLWKESLKNIKIVQRKDNGVIYHQSAILENHFFKFTFTHNSKTNTYTKKEWSSILEKLSPLIQNKDNTDYDILEKHKIRHNKFYHNKLFQTACDNNKKNNWSDFEYHYYEKLKKISLKSNLYETSIENPLSDISHLNTYLEVIRLCFEQYLHDYVSPNINESIVNNDILDFMFEKYQSNEFSIKGKKALTNSLLLCNKIKNSNIKNPINKEEMILENTIESINIINDSYSKAPSQIFLINFNYTELDKYYFINRPEHFKKADNQIYRIPIHGTLKSSNNPIIFGYGDEHCPKYKELEQNSESEYFKNFKSFKYLETDYYNQFINALESDNFQVHIYGHSCSLSDRSLLHLIFNHKNCCSIKIFYRSKGDNLDNYLDIAQGISKCFEDKNKFRELVVNKTLCKPFITTK